MPDESKSPLAGATASLLVLAMGLGWGFNWIAARVILEWLPPWTMRALGIGLGALTIFVAAYVRRTALDIPRPQRLHIVVSAVFNVLILNVCSAYSQIFGTTSREIVIVYSMPIWSALLARKALHHASRARHARRLRRERLCRLDGGDYTVHVVVGVDV